MAFDAMSFSLRMAFAVRLSFSRCLAALMCINHGARSAGCTATDSADRKFQVQDWFHRRIRATHQRHA